MIMIHALWIHVTRPSGVLTPMSAAVALKVPPTLTITFVRTISQGHRRQTSAPSIHVSMMTEATRAFAETTRLLVKTMPTLAPMKDATVQLGSVSTRRSRVTTVINVPRTSATCRMAVVRILPLSAMTIIHALQTPAQNQLVLANISSRTAMILMFARMTTAMLRMVIASMCRLM